ncbi:glycosyltransferase family 2 protein [Methanomethylophilus alvi]|uniref:glycosyltransferase family 2 protein n=1 Tax=Methanomethylophilus alvi TaxID=1291540 RepID=UPI0037DDAF23
MTPTVSVIVPIYNVEKYLPDCINSLKQQTLSDIEIILVDDGSTDNSYDIACELCKGDCRFRLIHQSNGGTGSARNLGVRIARGKYIGFVDSDDYVDPNYYKKMYDCAELHGSDMTILGHINTTSGAPILLSFPGSKYSMDELSKISFNAIDYPYILENVFLWNRIYLKDFWLKNNFFIPEGRKFAEDLLICTQTSVMANRISVVYEPLYTYRVNRIDSLSSNLFSSNKKDDFIKAIAESIEFLSSISYGERFCFDFSVFVTHIFILQLKSKFKKKEYYEFFNKFCSCMGESYINLLKHSWLFERYPCIITGLIEKNPAKSYRYSKWCRILHI